MARIKTFEKDEVKQAIEFLTELGPCATKVQVTYREPCEESRNPGPPPPVTSEFAQNL